MAEYIEREAAIGMAVSGRIRALPTTEGGEDWIRVEEVRESLKRTHSADVAPVRHGRWETDTCHVYCSVCDKYADEKTDFCPNCGADMRESDS